MHTKEEKGLKSSLIKGSQ